MTDLKADLAYVIYGAARGEGWILPKPVAVAVAAAIVDRPGMLAALAAQYPARTDARGNPA